MFTFSQDIIKKLSRGSAVKDVTIRLPDGIFTATKRLATLYLIETHFSNSEVVDDGGLFLNPSDVITNWRENKVISISD